MRLTKISSLSGTLVNDRSDQSVLNSLTLCRVPLQARVSPFGAIIAVHTARRKAVQPEKRAYKPVQKQDSETKQQT